MKKRMAINGFGRIGRLAFKSLINDENIEVVAINDLSSAQELAYLIKYDSIHGRVNEDIKCEDEMIIYNGKRVKVFAEKDASLLPWEDLEVDLVLECSGAYTKLEDAKKHIEAGAKRVVISAPGKGEMKTIVYGVNEDELTGNEEVISAASCTTNCLAPVLKVLNDAYKIELGFMTTIHAYTNDQVNLDVQHKKGYMTRRGRACSLNIIPTSTGAATAIGKVIPELDGKLSGSAMRVPVGDGSMIDLTLKLQKKVTREEINDLFKNRANSILKYTEDPIVSSDVIGEDCGALVDGLSTEVLSTQEGELVKVIAWYDNEYGYTSQMIRTIKYFLNL